ncbi:glycoside hydrolase [Paraflavitalea soli]|uniref:Glycoside hydrolase n=1 Tax=Paraflavitalea soli TaxID=2315862 RepID=A0A3B7MZS0_9BACT|nr:glycosyl hydrolase family 28 protein [Paraflavitalea soli]AXY78586.1 glycoside hydrolase [Paraflavitalea soli]
MSRKFFKGSFLAAMAWCMAAPAGYAQQYNITSSGAVGDGTTDNTIAIQKAIDSCTITGGTVYFPGGTFLSGTIVLKSNVTLHLSAKAVLLGQPAAKHYPYQQSGIPFYGEDWAKQALIFCKNQENVKIEGEGTIDGQGASFVINTIKKPDRYKDRPYLLWFAGCKKVTVTGVRLRNSAFWMQHYLGCEQVLIDGINIWNHSNKNNDMIDIDGCRYVTISNVTGDSDDDGITIKSTSKLISEYITITNCILSSHCSALKFGTESTGGYRNIVISNTVIKPSAQVATIYGRPAGISGLALELVDGGIMENISISNMVIEGPEVPLFIRLGNRARQHVASAPIPATGKLKNISISNIIATGANDIGCSISGLAKAPVENISLHNISIEMNGGGTAADAVVVPEEKEVDYPEATMFGKLPSYGFFIRHATDVRLSDIRLRYKTADARPAFAVSGTDGFTLTGLNVQSAAGTEAVVVVKDSKNGIVGGNVPEFPARRLVKQDQQSVNIKVIK